MQINRALLQQFGEVIRIDFENIKLLEEEFKNAAAQGKTPISISDSFGSMGSVAPVVELTQFAETYEGYNYLDDAHGTSVFGTYGAGYVHHILKNKISKRIILVGSLSKAFGAHGGFIVGSKSIIEFIRKYSVTHAFGGPPSLPGIAAALASSKLHLSGEIDRLQIVLAKRLKEFDRIFGAHNLVNGNTDFPIRGLVIGDEFEAIRVAKSLHAAGLACTVAMYPTVSKGEAMLRFAISVKHTISDFIALAAAIEMATNNKLNTRILN